jgi:TPR repeat protein
MKRFMRHGFGWFASRRAPGKIVSINTATARFTRVMLLAATTLTSAAFVEAAPLVSGGSHETRVAIQDYNAGNLPVALAEFAAAARHGDRLAQFNYAMMLLNGEGAPANVVEGKRWLHTAAVSGMSHAQYVLGRMYDDGEFVTRDPAEAHGWFLKAARQGHTQAQLSLANQFLDGRGTKRDNHQAFIWYSRAARGGDMTAQYVVGSFYEHGGDGVEKNLNTARVYYAAAAVQGDPAAKLKFQDLSQELAKEAPGKGSNGPSGSARPGNGTGGTGRAGAGSITGGATIPD